MMIRLVFLILAIVFQVVAAVLALRLMRQTKYRASWVLISLGFMLLAFTRGIKLIQFLKNDDFSFYLTMADDWLAVITSLLFTIGVFLIGEIFFALKRAEIQRKRSENRLLNAIIQTEEKERRRFSKDMHDGIGPLLSTAKMSVSALMKNNTDKNDIEILKNVNLVIDEAINSIKEISDNLVPHVLTNFGLVSAVRNFINKINQTKIINIDFFANVENIRFENNSEVILYRITCELINNTIKHAEAKNITIHLSKHRSTLTIQYADDGIGFFQDEMNKENTKGMGLSNISSRIKSIHGVFILNSTPSEGTNALIKVQINENKTIGKRN